ncbi:MAG: hypothetical protein QGG02_01385 [Gammaproteobacteria bacterium]|nr:hypothetical protein [Gammaproteobacteria bacterium]
MELVIYPDNGTDVGKDIVNLFVVSDVVTNGPIVINPDLYVPLFSLSQKQLAPLTTSEVETGYGIRVCSIQFS